MMLTMIKEMLYSGGDLMKMTMMVAVLVIIIKIDKMSYHLVLGWFEL